MFKKKAKNTSVISFEEEVDIIPVQPQRRINYEDDIEQVYKYRKVEVENQVRSKADSIDIQQLIQEQMLANEECKMVIKDDIIEISEDEVIYVPSREEIHRIKKQRKLPDFLSYSTDKNLIDQDERMPMLGEYKDKREYEEMASDDEFDRLENDIIKANRYRINTPMEGNYKQYNFNDKVQQNADKRFMENISSISLEAIKSEVKQLIAKQRNQQQKLLEDIQTSERAIAASQLFVKQWHHQTIELTTVIAQQEEINDFFFNFNDMMAEKAHHLFQTLDDFEGIQIKELNQYAQQLQSVFSDVSEQFTDLQKICTYMTLMLGDTAKFEQVAATILQPIFNWTIILNFINGYLENKDCDSHDIFAILIGFKSEQILATLIQNGTQVFKQIVQIDKQQPKIISTLLQNLIKHSYQYLKENNLPATTCLEQIQQILNTLIKNFTKERDEYVKDNIRAFVGILPKNNIDDLLQ